jgi:catechol 2,3-dioxygenase-like lactoylglutathione lyase family enzyme
VRAQSPPVSAARSTITAPGPHARHGLLVDVGGRTAIGIQRCATEHENERFVPNRVGLDHLCLRARSREDVDAAASKLREMGAYIDRGPAEGNFAPGYYFFAFEDPDGTRLELNFIPGKGLLVSLTTR